MTPRRVLSVACLCLAGASIVGCQQKEISMEEAMKPPPRPAELDMLGNWVGNWNGSGDMTMYTKDGPQKMTATYSERIEWIAGSQFLLARSEMNMGEGETMQMAAVFGWDRNEKEFRGWEFMSNGDTSTMEMEYDKEAGHWDMEGRGKNPMTGEPTYSQGTMKMVDDNTIEWQFTMWDSWKLKKIMDGKGTSRKQ